MVYIREFVKRRLNLIIMIAILSTIIIVLNSIFIMVIENNYEMNIHSRHKYLVEDEIRHTNFVAQKMESGIDERRDRVITMRKSIMSSAFEATVAMIEQGVSVIEVARNISLLNKGTTAFYYTNGVLFSYIDGVQFVTPHASREEILYSIPLSSIYFLHEVEGTNDIYALTMAADALIESTKRHILTSYDIEEGLIDLWVNNISDRVGKQKSLNVFVDDDKNFIIKDLHGKILYKTDIFATLPVEQDFYKMSEYIFEYEGDDIPQQFFRLKYYRDYNVLVGAITNLTMGKEIIEAGRIRSEAYVQAQYYVAFLTSVVLIFIISLAIYRIQSSYFNKIEDFGNRILEKSNVIKSDYENLKEEVGRDILTGLYNRTYVNQNWKDFVSAKAGETYYAMGDIDKFKMINDTYGHNVGDFVLRNVAKIISDSFPEKDILLARWGGEEFLIIMPYCNELEAYRICERARIVVQESDFIYDGLQLGVTISFGMAVDTPQDESFNDVMIRADKALYISKDTGRNKVTVYR